MNWATAFFAGDNHPDHHKPLDGLRGLAVLMVVFGHAQITAWALSVQIA